MDDAKKMLLIQLFLSSAVTLGWTFFIPYTLSVGFSVLDILLYALVIWVSPFIVLSIKKTIDARKAMSIGLFARMLAFVLAISFLFKEQIFLISLMFGVMIIYFWLSINTLYEKITTKSNRAFRNSLFLFVWPFTRTILPAVGGILASLYGYPSLFVIGTLLVLPTVFIAQTVKKTCNMHISLPKHLNKHIVPLTFIEGVWNGTIWITIGIITLTFITEPKHFGTFFSYLGLMGAASSILLGVFSDKIKRRLRFAFTIVAFSSLFTILSSLSHTFYLWTVATGFLFFFSNMTTPFLWTVITETTSKTFNAMLNREIGLALGRMFGTLIAIISYLLGDLHLSLMIAGFIFITYPLAFVLLRIHLI